MCVDEVYWRGELKDTLRHTLVFIDGMDVLRLFPFESGLRAFREGRPALDYIEE